jgi:putative hydrolase of the HAD superfamily
LLLPKDLKAVSFDLDDTLWPVAGVIAHAEQAGLAWFRQHAPDALEHLAPERRAALRAEALNGLDADDPRRQDMRYMRTALYRTALVAAGYDAELAAVAFSVFDNARQEVEPYDDALAALERIATRFRMIAVTNGSADVRRIGWDRFFEASVSPSEAGAAKPNPGIYRHACALLHLEPSEILHVGDDALLDVDAARAAGLHAVWINRLQKDWPSADAAPLTFTDLTSLAAWLCPN